MAMLTAFGIGLDLAGIVEHILRILPKTRNIEVVTGNSPFERFWQTEFQRDTQHLTKRVQFNWLNELSFEEIDRRLSRLPPDSAIVYFLLVLDAAGVPYEQERALDVLRRDSNAPIFGIFDHQLGRGIVGGPLSPYQEVSRQSARAALQILNGTPASAIKPVFLGPAAPEYDWRELASLGHRRITATTRQRHSISFADNVGAIPLVHHRSVRHHRGSGTLDRWVALAPCAAPSRRERLFVESREFMELSTNAGELGLWARDLECDDLWTNPRLRSLFGFGRDDVLRLEDMIGRIHPDDRARVIVQIERAQRTGEPFEGEFRVLIPDGSERWVATKGRTVAESG